MMYTDHYIIGMQRIFYAWDQLLDLNTCPGPIFGLVSHHSCISVLNSFIRYPPPLCLPKAVALLVSPPHPTPPPHLLHITDMNWGLPFCWESLLTYMPYTLKSNAHLCQPNLVSKIGMNIRIYENSKNSALCSTYSCVSALALFGLPRRLSFITSYTFTHCFSLPYTTDILV